MEDAERLFLHALILRFGGVVTITNDEIANARHRAKIVMTSDDSKAFVIDLGPKVLALEIDDLVSNKPWN